ncbi:MAG: hypothetical protein QE267_06160, partial [Akkermansiaceae bacterium]|nr:hypothetical protein [Akkermansiaceae bacterium]
MKINPPFATRRVLQAAMIVALAATSHPALAANYYWDTTSPIQTLGYGTASGTWGSDSFWSLSNNGTATTGIANPTVGDTLQFGTGSPNGLAEGNITVTGNQTAGNLTFASASGSIGFSGGTIIFAATSNSTTNNSTITVNNVANTISSVITSTGNLTKNGVGNLTLDPGADNISTLGGLRISAGSMVLKSGTMNATIAGAFRLGGSSSPGFTIDGGTLLTRGNTQVGGDVSGGKGLLTINNGTWTNSAGATYLGQGSGGTGTIMTVNGGQVSSANGMEIGTNNTTVTLNLNGGTTSVARLFNGNNSTAIV